MQSEPTQPKSSSPDHDRLSSSNIIRRTSERATKAVPEEPESSNGPSTARRSLTRNSPQQGSSREMTPAEDVDAVKYTRTGRVCRANKGRRVHYCEECGKTYTRAEHLRRHQQNHKPGSFPCDIPGCGKSFYREDLLVRHKARHNDPPYSDSALSSPRSQDSAPTAEVACEFPSLVQQMSTAADSGTLPAIAQETVDRDYRSTMSETSSKTRSSEASIRQRRYSLLHSSDGHSEYEGAGDISDSSLPHLVSGRTSPTTQFMTGLPYYLSPDTARQSSSASYLCPYVPSQSSHSPASVDSSIAYSTYWDPSVHPNSLHYLEGVLGSADPSSINIEGYTNGMTDMQLVPEYRDMMEQVDLSVYPDSSELSTLNFNTEETTYTNEQRYLDAYWSSVHQFFPIVHRHFFIQYNTSPLLKASMLALGAQAVGSGSDMTYARVVHERCVKVLTKRTLKGSHSFRTCDMQAAVLIEIFSIFKSRRPPHQFSKHFEDVYKLLAEDPEAQQQPPFEEAHLHSQTRNSSPFSSDFADNVFCPSDPEYKQRLLLACYILDQQHALLFGRLRSNAFSGDGRDLPFPRDQSSWDGNDSLRQIREELVHWPVHNIGDHRDSGQHVHDLFQSMLMVGSFFDSRREFAMGQTFRDGDDSTILPVAEYSPRTKIAYHTLMLCDNTPIRDLLAVAGETWVMSEKLVPSDYTAAQIRTREWAIGHTETNFAFGITVQQSQVYRAVTHALKILELHQSHPKTGLLFQEWSIYLASIVIWARSYVLSSERLRNAIQSAAKRQMSSHLLDQIVSLVSAAGPDRNISLEEAMDILLWTKNKILWLSGRDKSESVNVSHNCGLTSGSLDVLGRLIAKGAEKGRFGS